MKCKLAVVLKPHGLKGLMKVCSCVDNIKDIALYPLYIDDKCVNLVQITGITDKYAIIEIQDINSYEKALTFQNKSIETMRVNLPQLPEGEYYWCDLVGCTVYDNNKALGSVSEVYDDGGGLLLKLNTNKYALFAWIDKIDLKSKSIFLEDGYVAY